MDMNDGKLTKHRIMRRIGGVAVALRLAQAGMAATITYSTYVVPDSADTSWVSPADTLQVCAINFGSANAQSFGGVNWSSGIDGGWGCGNANLTPYINFSEPGVAWGNNATTFYPGGPALLDEGAFLGAAAGVVTMGGFTVGKHYLIQFVVADNRDFGGGGGVNEIPGRTITMQGSGGTIGGQNSAQVQYAYADGRYAVVTAGFVADATEFRFVPLVGDGSPGTQINAVQIREVMTFDGVQASDTTAHIINATDWADYLGGDPTFASANGGGRLYWRGSAGDGNYMHFDLSSLAGKTNVAPAFVTLQNGNTTWGGGVDGSFVATADGSWTAGAGQAIPGATSIANAVNAGGSYASGSSVSWGIGSSALQSLVDNPASDYGLAVIGGASSQLHFNGPMSPYLTVKTGTLSGSPVAGVVTVGGGTAWNAANYSFDAGDSYSAAASLRIWGAVAGATNGAGNVTVNGANVLVYQPGGAANYYWAVDSTTINADGTLTINGHSHIHNLTLAGGELGGTAVDGTWGGWTFDDATTVTGGTTSVISARQVNLDNGNITVGPGSTLEFTGTIRSGSLTKAGDGTMVLTQVNAYTGGTTVNGGILEVAGGGGWGRIIGTLTVNAGGTVVTTGDGTGLGWNNQISAVNINGGMLTSDGAQHIWNITSGINLAGGTLQSNNGVNDAGGAQFEWNRTSVNVTGDSTSTIAGRIRIRGENGYSAITFNVSDGAAATDLLVSAPVTEASAWLGIIKTGDGTLTLSGASSYSGSTTVSGGRLSITGGGKVYSGAGWNGRAVAVNGTGVLEIDQWSGDGSLGESDYGSGGLVLDGGTLRYIGSETATPSFVDGGNGRSFSLGAGGGTLESAAPTGYVFAISHYNSNPAVYALPGFSSTLTVTGTGDGYISKAVSGTGGLTKSGSGTWTLAGANTYTGDTQIDAGTLRLGADNTLDADNNVVLGGGALDAGGFSNQLGSLQVTSSSSMVVSAGSLRFLDSYMVNWTGTLTLVGTLGPQSVRFGNSANALTAGQLQKISIDGHPVDIDANGYLTKASQGTVFILR